MMRLVLEQAGYRLVEADDVDAAVSTAQDEAVNLLIVDPTFFGDREAELIEKLGQPKILLITDQGTVPTPAVAAVILQRPFDSATLIDTVRGILAQSP